MALTNEVYGNELGFNIVNQLVSALSSTWMPLNKEAQYQAELYIYVPLNQNVQNAPFTVDLGSVWLTVEVKSCFCFTIN